MKFDNSLQKEIVEFFNKDNRFYFHGYTGTHWFKSVPKNEDGEWDFIRLTKPSGGKSLAIVTIRIYSSYEKTNSVELAVDMNISQTDETHFYGWVESMDEFKMMMKLIGL